jgi:hypothetical protein
MGDESKRDTSIWGRLQEIDTRILYWVLFIVIAIPYLRPLGIPIEVSDPVNDFLKSVDSLPPGSVILIENSLSPGGWGEHGPGLEAFLKYTAYQYPTTHNGGKLKLLVTSGSEIGPVSWDKVFTPILEPSVMEYGEDYVYLGFISGLETYVARLAEDIHSLVSVDYYGTSLENIPMMAEIIDYSDVAMIIPVECAEWTEWYIKHWGQRGVLVSGIVCAIYIPRHATFYEGGQMTGYVGSSRGSAELELLVNQPGAAISTTDTLSTSHLWIIVLIILGNLGYFLSRRTGGE